MENVIVTAILLAIAGSIVFYLIRAKKSGKTCAGCPNSKQCNGHCNGKCGNTDPSKNP